MLQRANVAVFVLSGRPGLWQSQEMAKAAALKHGTIVPVLVGTSTQVPAQLTAFPAVRVTDADSARKLAQKMAKEATGAG